MTYSYYVVVNHSLKVVYEPCYELSAAQAFKADLLVARPGDNVDVVAMNGTILT